MYNKKDTLASLVLVIITFVTVNFIIHTAQEGNTTALDAGPVDRVQAKNAKEHRGMASAKVQPRTHDIPLDTVARTLPEQGDKTHIPQQKIEEQEASRQKAGEQKNDDWRKELDRLNSRLQKWFDTPRVQKDMSNNAPPPTRTKEEETAKDKRVVEPHKVENARKNVSFKDKMEILSIIAKVSPEDVRKVSQLIGGGVTMEEGREIDSILKQHLSEEEMKALNRIIKKYITW